MEFFLIKVKVCLSGSTSIAFYMLVRIPRYCLHDCEKYLDSVYMLVRSTSIVLYMLVRGYLFTNSNINIKLPGIFLKY